MGKFEPRLQSQQHSILTEPPAEEIRDASIVLPRGMMWTLILNGTTGFIMTVTFAFCLGNLENALTPTYGFTYIDVFYNSTQSRAGATVMACIIILMALCSTISNVATASRQMFAFARDQGLPFSDFLSQVRIVPRKTSSTTNSLAGQTWLGYPPKCRDGFIRDHLSSLTN